MQDREIKRSTLPSLIHEFINWKKVTSSLNTIRAYRETLECFAHYCFDRAKDPLIPKTINDWVAHMRTPKKGRRRRKGCTINNYIGRLSSFFDWAIQMEYLVKNPTKLTPRLPPERSHVRGFKEDEVKELLVAAGADETRPYWTPMILLGHHYGMRIQDCCEFSSSCVDWRRMRFTFMPGKQSRKEIELPLHGDVAAALKSVTPGSVHYFPVAAKRYYSTTVTAEFKSIVIRAGLPTSLSFHCLRHGAATNMIKAGIGLTTIVEIIGWSSTAMLQRYLDRDDDEISKLTLSGSVMSPLPQCSAP